jgi:ATP-dependent DNA ligase
VACTGIRSPHGMTRPWSSACRSSGLSRLSIRLHLRAKLDGFRALAYVRGIVGKRAPGTYQTDGRRTSWVKIKIKNPDYSQMQDRHELCETRYRRWRRTKQQRPDLALR